MYNIFYGAGRNAKINISRWVANGLEPVCFVDLEKSKHHFYFCDLATDKKYEVLSLEEATFRYPDYMIYIVTVPKSYWSIRKQLIFLGINKDRISYIDKTESKYCGMKIKNVHFYKPEYKFDKHKKYKASNCLMDCCCYRSVLRFEMSDSINDSINTFNKAYDDLIEQMYAGCPTPCDDCYYLTTAPPPPPSSNIFRETKICINTGIIGGNKCNIKCCYCSPGNVNNYNGNKNRMFSVIDILQYISENFNPDDVIMFYSSGELTISECRDEVLDLWEKNDWKGFIFTNCVNYDERIESLISRGKVKLIPSLDCGTRETFITIKGVDCFDTVVANLIKYSKAATPAMLLKYILLDNLNDSDEEINAFLSLVDQKNLQCPVQLSHDFNMYRTKSMTLNKIKRIKYFIEQANKYNINVVSDSSAVSHENALQIEVLKLYNNFKIESIDFNCAELFNSFARNSE